MTNAVLAEHWDLVGVVARTDASLERVRRGFCLPASRLFKSLDEALATLPGVDAVVVATPNHLHLEHALKVLRAEKHLILEKPIVNDLREAEALFSELSRHPRVKAMVGQTARGSPVHRAAARAISSGVVGDVEMATVRALGRWVDDPKEKWRFALRHVMLDDVGIHQVDALRMLLGERRALSVYAEEFNPRWYPLETLTTCSALLEMEGGVHVNYFSSLSATDLGTGYVGAFQVHGSEGSVLVERDAAWVVPADDPRNPRRLEPADGSGDRIGGGGGDDANDDDVNDYEGLAWLLEDFHEAIERDREPFAGLANNLHSFLIVEALKLSARLGRRVDVSAELHAPWMPGV